MYKRLIHIRKVAFKNRKTITWIWSSKTLGVRNMNLAFLLLAISIPLTLTAPAENEIKNLPGLHEKLNFRQYSGYLDGGNGQRLFYWFVESQKNATTDPVILWLNGGPGCSSLQGFFAENGPFRVQQDRVTLKVDRWSWNTLGNVLYLESPVDVGFSHRTKKLDSAEKYNDTATTDANYHALIDFFRKFPEFKRQKFYITGESYAGVYIPLLTQKILDAKHENEINLQGIAIGNGAYDISIMATTRLEYAYSHGLIGLDVWQKIRSTCCHRSKTNHTDTQHELECDYPRMYSNYLRTVNHNRNCTLLVEPVVNSINKYFNIYNIYSACDEESPVDHKCPHQFYGDYLNQPAVRKALHVNDHESSHLVANRRWMGCNPTILNTYNVMFDSMDFAFRQITDKHHMRNVVLYNGDADIVCDFMSTQRFLLRRMRYRLSETSQPWLSARGKLMGVASRFENGLRYYTVHGAGHLVPTNKPEAALAIVKDLLDIEKIA